MLEIVCDQCGCNWRGRSRIRLYIRYWIHVLGELAQEFLTQ